MGREVGALAVGVWGYNPMCKVTPVILHGVVYPYNPVQDVRSDLPWGCIPRGGALQAASGGGACSEGAYMECVSIERLSGNQVYYAILQIFLVKIMLCSKINNQKVFELKHDSSEAQFVRAPTSRVWSRGARTFVSATATGAQMK